MKRNGIIASILSMALLLTGCGTDSSSDMDNAQAETTTTTKATTTTKESTTTVATTTTEEATTTTEEITTAETTTTTKETTTAQTTTAQSSSSHTIQTTATSSTDAIEWEEAVAAETGDAFLFIADGQYWLQYDGTADFGYANYLSYGAGIAAITGDGEYTVSVNAGTKACQNYVTGDPNGNYKCEGIGWAAVRVMGGTTLYPEMSIEVTEVRVDGKAVDLTALNYTNSDDGIEMRANIYNHWINKLPEDAHTADGPIGTTVIGEYSPIIVDPDDFASWTTVEVDFIVTGTGR